MPSQLAPQTVSWPVQAERGVRGGPLMATHLPLLPCSPQASHWPAQALSQQTLSTQNLEVQADALVQAEPFASGAPASGAPASSDDTGTSATTSKLASVPIPASAFAFGPS